MTAPTASAGEPANGLSGSRSVRKPGRLWGQHPRDAALLVGAALHGLVWLALAALALTDAAALPLPSMWLARGGAVLLYAFAMVWGCNTVAHLHLHAPLFRSAALSGLFSLYLTLLLGVPQGLWRRRHLAHHGIRDAAGERWGAMRGEILLLAAGLMAALALAPRFVFGLWLPGTALGLGLCALQGRGEHPAQAHRRGSRREIARYEVRQIEQPTNDAEDGLDFRGRLYNRLWFNDGFHRAHHRQPSLHWTELPGATCPTDPAGALPPLLRGLAGAPPALLRALSQRPLRTVCESTFRALRRAMAAFVPALLDHLERRALARPTWRAFLLDRHRRALARLLPRLQGHTCRDILIVGGGLFPRSALLLGEAFPQAQLTLVDQERAHLDEAVRWLPDELRRRCRLVCRSFSPEEPLEADLLVLPLALRGDRRQIHQHPPAARVLVHDWLWRRPRASSSVRVAWLLAKRMTLVEATAPGPTGGPEVILSLPAPRGGTLEGHPVCSPPCPTPTRADRPLSRG